MSDILSMRKKERLIREVPTDEKRTLADAEEIRKLVISLRRGAPFEEYLNLVDKAAKRIAKRTRK